MTRLDADDAISARSVAAIRARVRSSRCCPRFDWSPRHSSTTSAEHAVDPDLQHQCPPTSSTNASARRASVSTSTTPICGEHGQWLSTRSSTKSRPIRQSTVHQSVPSFLTARIHSRGISDIWQHPNTASGPDATPTRAASWRSEYRSASFTKLHRQRAQHGLHSRYRKAVQRAAAGQFRSKVGLARAAADLFGHPEERRGPIQSPTTAAATAGTADPTTDAATTTTTGFATTTNADTYAAGSDGWVPRAEYAAVYSPALLFGR